MCQAVACALYQVARNLGKSNFTVSGYVRNKYEIYGLPECDSVQVGRTALQYIPASMVEIEREEY